jgi:glycosyltransferase involved in cell wall biosynthesis
MKQLVDPSAEATTLMASRAVRYSVVVPIYGNRDSLVALVDRLAALNERLGGGLEGVFVVDGSPDDSLAVLREILAGGALEAQVLSHSRNFGSASAVRSGLAVARGDYIAVMAADLQEPPEVAESFFNLLEADECDIALGERIGRDDPATSAAMASLYWRLYQRFINREIPTGGVDVFGCTRSIAQRIVSFPETHTSLIALLYWLGYRRRYVQYRRQARHSGVSAWTFSRKLRLLFDSIYAFTDLPIILLQVIGFAGTIFSFLIGVIVFVGWLLGAVKQPGYTPIMIAIAGSASALLLGLGVVGSYVWRTYENSKSRPLELVATHEYFEP